MNRSESGQRPNYMRMSFNEIADYAFFLVKQLQAVSDSEDYARAASIFSGLQLLSQGQDTIENKFAGSRLQDQRSNLTEEGKRIFDLIALTDRVTSRMSELRVMDEYKKSGS